MLQGCRIGLLSGCLVGLAAANPAEARRLLDRGDYESARDLYQSLADSTRLPARRAALRLGEGLSAYRGEDFRGARAGYSGALMSLESRVRGSAHLGLGNSLFQLGWMGMAESAYPSDPGEIPDLDQFDAIARARIARMLDSPEPETGETDGFARIRDTILNWSDAARHYQSALDLNPGDEAALANRRTTMAFLDRLRDLLEEERDDTAQSIPEPMPEPGEGQPEPGEGEGEGEGEPENEGEPGEEPDGEKPDEPGEEENPDGGGDKEEGEPTEGEGEPQDDPQEGEGQQEAGDDEPSESEPGDPNESPEERARRILSENADVETGPLNPGRRMILPPEKDW